MLKKVSNFSVFKNYSSIFKNEYSNYNAFCMMCSFPTPLPSKA